MNRDRVLAFAQLLRLPNVFTAFADIALAACVALALVHTLDPTEFCISLVLLCLASGSLYLSGMVWNDVFDRDVDARERPFRPIPSGRVSMGTAVALASGLTVAGMCFAWVAGGPWRAEWDHEPFVLSIALVITIFLYNAWLKHTFIGPLAMAWCRTNNLALGLTLVSVEHLPAGFPPTAFRFLLAAQGWYIVAVTALAKNEAGTSRRSNLLLLTPFFALSGLLALIVRARLPADTGTVFFPYLLVGFGFWIGRPIARAYRNPGPREVQYAVKRCIMGIAMYDAVLATMFVGLPGLLLLLLLPPALVLGKWVYST